MDHPRGKKILGRGLLGLLVVFVAAQLVPYGRAHTNPPVVSEPRWDQPRTRALAVRACFDCHSNQTAWPWYASVAPASWLTQRHVDEGRRVLNFSDWSRAYEAASECAEEVLEGKMPTRDYALVHPHARLSDEERRALAAGLTATLGQASREHRADD